MDVILITLRGSCTYSPNVTYISFSGGTTVVRCRLGLWYDSSSYVFTLREAIWAEFGARPIECSLPRPLFFVCVRVTATMALRHLDGDFLR